MYTWTYMTWTCMLHMFTRHIYANVRVHTWKNALYIWHICITYMQKKCGISYIYVCVCVCLCVCVCVCVISNWCNGDGSWFPFLNYFVITTDICMYTYMYAHIYMCIYIHMYIKNAVYLYHIDAMLLNVTKADKECAEIVDTDLRCIC